MISEEKVKSLIESVVDASKVDGEPRIGVLTKSLIEVLGPLGFKITPPTHFYSAAK